jgi:acyl-CoA thioesterase-2
MDEPLEAPPGGWVRELLDHLRLDAVDGHRFRGRAPNWFGDRVFGGFVIGQAITAALGSVGDIGLHSLHATFLAAVTPGDIEWRVERLRDGRTFTTRQVSAWQRDREACRVAVSFHQPEPGDEYAVSMPEAPPPDDVARSDGPPVWETRDIGPTPRRSDGTFRSTRRAWVRAVDPQGDDPNDHVALSGFLSDFTGTSFRPLTEPIWGTHTDASIDHAVWFHRPFRVDDWVYCDFHALINHGGRSTIRGEFYSDGRLCMSMAQELLIRPLVA